MSLMLRSSGQTGAGKHGTRRSSFSLGSYGINVMTLLSRETIEPHARETDSSEQSHDSHMGR